MIEKKEKKLG